VGWGYRKVFIGFECVFFMDLVDQIQIGDRRYMLLEKRCLIREDEFKPVTERFRKEIDTMRGSHDSIILVKPDEDYFTAALYISPNPSTRG